MSLQSTDQIADLITRIRNANMVGKNEIRVATSKLKVAVIETLVKNGYLASYDIEDAKPRGMLHVVIAVDVLQQVKTELVQAQVHNADTRIHLLKVNNIFFQSFQLLLAVLQIVLLFR